VADPWFQADLSLPVGRPGLRVAVSTDAPCVGLVGPSGAGKSTLLRVIAGVERRATGTLTVFGERWAGPGVHRPAWERRVGWVPQDAALFPHLDVRANLTYAGRDGLAELGAWLELDDLLDRAPRGLSGGERQRVALGRALLARPRICLFDEPFAALDRTLRERLARELSAWCAARGVRVWLVTHDERDLAPFEAERWEIGLGEVRRG